MSPTRPIAAALSALVAACAAPAPPPPAGEGGPPIADSDSVESGTSGSDAVCEPLAIELVAEWTEAELTQLTDTSGLVGVALGDLDGDGWLDGLFAGHGGGVGLLGDGAGGLEITDAFTVDGSPLPGGHAVALADLDGDGDLDGYWGRSQAADLILWNDGAGRFTAAPLTGSEGAAFTGSFGDADGDGDLDLFVAAGALDISAEAVVAGESVGDPNLLYLQQPDGRFALTDDRLPSDTLDGITFEGAWLDADGDGDLDLYVANDAGPYIDPNHLLLNDGAGTFTEASDCGCDLAMFAMGAAVGDADGDGAPDLYLTDVGSPNLLLNTGAGAFYDATLASGAAIPPTEESMVSWGTRFADLDRDGCQDLVVIFGVSGQNSGFVSSLNPDWVDGEQQPDVILMGDCDGGFVRAESLGFADPDRGRSVALGDLDRDGRVDLVTAGKPFIKVWSGDGGCPPGVRVTLDGGAGNGSGIGARVVARFNGRETTHWMLPGSASSSSAPELYLGLDGAAAAESVEVVWPDGSSEIALDVPAGADLSFTR